MIPDPCGKVPPHAPRNSSGEIAADHVLHVQRFTLPLGLNTPPKPRLGRRPPPATVLTSEHHPPPTLDDMAKRPKVPGRSGPVQRQVEVLLEPGPIGFIERPVLPLKPMAASPTVIPPEYGPTPSSTQWLCTTLPRPGPMLHPRCIAFLSRFRVESRAVGRRPSGTCRLVEDASGA